MVDLPGCRLMCGVAWTHRWVADRLRQIKKQGNKKTPPDTQGCHDGAGTEKRPKCLLWGDNRYQAIAFHKNNDLWLEMLVDILALLLSFTNDHTHFGSRVQLFGTESPENIAK